VLETCFRHQGLRAINVNLSLLYEGTSIGEGMNLGLGRIRYILAVLFVAVLCAAPAASAEEMVFELDPALSRIEFTVSAVLHTVHGQFQLKRGSIRFDPATGMASGELVVDATSANSGNKMRDGIMHEDVLESQKYPEITFALQHVRGNLTTDGTSQVEMQGIMTLHGQPHPMTITVPVRVSQGQASADVPFTVPFIQWGLKDPSVLFLRVKNTVGVTVHAVGRFTAAPSPAIAGPGDPGRER